MRRMPVPRSERWRKEVLEQQIRECEEQEWIRGQTNAIADRSLFVLSLRFLSSSDAQLLLEVVSGDDDLHCLRLPLAHDSRRSSPPARLRPLDENSREYEFTLTS